jgi:hypothetical protein
VELWGTELFFEGWGTELLKEVIICSIGNGASVNIWLDPWMPRDIKRKTCNANRPLVVIKGVRFNRSFHRCMG